MKQITLFLLLFFCVSTYKTQQLDIDWGEEFDSKSEVQKILGYSEGKLISYSIKGKKRFISTYAKDGFKELSSGEFILPKLEGKKSGMLNLVVTGDHVTAILYVYMKKTKSFSLYSQEIGLNGACQGTPKKIYTSNESGDKIKDLKVELVVSQKGSKAMVYFDRANKTRTEFYCDVIVLNLGTTLEVVSITEHTYAMRASKSERIKYQLYHSVENDGTYNIIQEKIDFAKSKISDFTLVLTRYNADGSEIGEAKIVSDGKVLLSPTMIVKKDAIYVVGYFMNNPKNRAKIAGYSGLFLTKLSKSMNIISQKETKFSDEFKTNLYSEKKIAKMNGKGKELLVPAPYRMKEIVVHNDGSFTVLSEYYLVTVTTNGKGSKTTNTNYGPILFFKLNSSGDIVAGDVIKKNQYSSTISVSISAVFEYASVFVSIEFADKMKKYWSYASSVAHDKIYLVFNDHFKNSGDSGDELSRPLYYAKKSVPFLVTINKDGTFEKKAMVSSGDSDTYIVPQVTYETSQSEFIIWGIWRKLNKFGTATISK